MKIIDEELQEILIAANSGASISLSSEAIVALVRELVSSRQQIKSIEGNHRTIILDILDFAANETFTLISAEDNLRAIARVCRRELGVPQPKRWL